MKTLLDTCSGCKQLQRARYRYADMPASRKATFCHQGDSEYPGKYIAAGWNPVNVPTWCPKLRGHKYANVNTMEVRKMEAAKVVVGVRRVGRISDVLAAMAATGMSEEQISARIAADNPHISKNAVHAVLTKETR